MDDFVINLYFLIINGVVQLEYTTHVNRDSAGYFFSLNGATAFYERGF